MPSTIIGLASSGYFFEPEVSSITGKDGITAFSFSVVGKLASLTNLYPIDSTIFGVPGQPIGTFKVVNRNVEHIAGGILGAYRLSVSAEGGFPSGIYISETSYTYADSQESGIRNVGTGANAIQIPITYKLEWVYPSATVTTNSSEPSDKAARALASQIVSALNVEIFSQRPANTQNGRRVGSKLIISGSSVERAGGLYRIRATASKGQVPEL